MPCIACGRHRWRNRQTAAAARRARCAGARGDRAVLHRRAYVRPAAEPSDHRAGGPVRPHRADRARLSPLRAGQSPRDGPRGGRRPPRVRRSRARSGRCPPPLSARCWRRCPRRWVSVPSRWRTGLPGLPRRSGRRRRCARHHPIRRLARLVAAQQETSRCMTAALTRSARRLDRCRHRAAGHPGAAGMARGDPAEPAVSSRQAAPCWIFQCRTTPTPRRCSRMSDSPRRREIAADVAAGRRRAADIVARRWSESRHAIPY